MKTKIIYLVTKDDVGGAQKYVADLAGHLNREQFDAKIITGGKSGARFLSNTFSPHFLFINDWLALAELFLIFKRERPAIVHLNSSKAGVIGAIAAKLAGVPKTIFTAHGWVFNPDNYLGFFRRRLYVVFHRIAAYFQDAIINVSEYDRQLAIKHKIAPTQKLITIHNGLDWQNLKFLDKRTARKAINTLSAGKIDGEIWVGSIGRLVTEKSYEDFVEAASLIKNTAARFLIIGDGFLKEKLGVKIKQLGLENRFFLVSEIAPAAPYLKALDIFLLSSIKEGLPYTLLEAMAAELPIITTRVGGMPEIMTNHGLVMPPREPEELARAIDYLLDHPEEAQRMAKSAGAFLRSKLSINEMIDATLKIYLNR